MPAALAVVTAVALTVLPAASTLARGGSPRLLVAAGVLAAGAVFAAGLRRGRARRPA